MQHRETSQLGYTDTLEAYMIVEVEEEISCSSKNGTFTGQSTSLYSISIGIHHLYHVKELLTSYLIRVHTGVKSVASSILTSLLGRTTPSNACR
jgi:hypothetical protein